ncbi:hypothetical protein CCHR01_14357 [Colletotrichum chrysophilum]|uniref:Uncharacterized protein n=1 Tax=Colletotrichum chrysophilum TaxID=1836956 RepID=A0AAD9EC10_9PEZI|nr:hypothetical protein CCHR01_14357 [Colletotrichum chrysophilum]
METGDPQTGQLPAKALTVVRIQKKRVPRFVLALEAQVPQGAIGQLNVWRRRHGTADGAVEMKEHYMKEGEWSGEIGTRC